MFKLFNKFKFLFLVNLILLLNSIRREKPDEKWLSYIKFEKKLKNLVDLS